jgi:exonuclease SbcC
VAGFDEHRHDLKDGEPCPLCGAKEHPFASGETSFESQLQTARKLLTTLEKQCEKENRDLDALERELAKTEAEVSAETKRVAEMRKALVEIDGAGCECLEAEEEGKRSET